MTSKQFLTRRESARFLRDNGFPMGDSTFEKLAMPSRMEGPPVAARWGNRCLYTPAGLLEWAQTRLRLEVEE